MSIFVTGISIERFDTAFVRNIGYLAASNAESWSWRSDFISSYIERDIPFMGPHINATTMRRLWSMLAHNNAQQVNYSKLGESLGVSLNN